MTAARTNDHMISRAYQLQSSRLTPLHFDYSVVEVSVFEVTTRLFSAWRLPVTGHRPLIEVRSVGKRASSHSTASLGLKTSFNLSFEL